MANEKANKVTFEQEAKIYEEKALAEIKKISGDGSEEPPDIACILQSGRRAIYMARQELASRVEVVHGRWVSSGCGFDCCSECRKVYTDGYFTAMGIKPRAQFNYCPNCGAKMDGERKDNG